ncbi:hypothetical protein BJF83_24790 [Nocardiopsis sp. CNR-923]|uniref:DUF6011 domain-containing protein n=1 Tax=Nocardiopsis sp. CNR-923 TaxID=1904965 RepID=UPI0009606D0F|nr:DUF6011 domain-containing protein [Nocardiopsis sp. CNR-923]OLT30473.1 hypothetical protein BJF83_24790 [Nocardiopsis sp. CNR-923]
MQAITTGAPTPVPCNRCGRPLHSADSRARGYGRGCLAKELAAARTRLARHSRTVASGAEEVLEIPGAISRLRGDIFVVVGRTGHLYRATPEQCSCRAGQRGAHVCYHRVAAAIIAASLGLLPAATQPRVFQVSARSVGLAA